MKFSLNKYDWDFIWRNHGNLSPRSNIFENRKIQRIAGNQASKRVIQSEMNVNFFQTFYMKEMSSIFLS